LRIILNGGVHDTAAVRAHLEQVDGVMIGREAYSNPYWLAELQSCWFAGHSIPRREQILLQMQDYAARELRQGVRLSHITRHLLGLYSGQGGARLWRRFVTEESRRPDAGADVLQRSLECFGEVRSLLA